MKERYYSLDVFRGATVAFMILVNNQHGVPYPPLDHAAWNGLTPTDLVFPFFLFAMGNALSFVMPRFEKEGTAFFLKKILYRTLLIFLIGLLLNWFPFVRWDHDRLVWKGWTWINDAGQVAGVRIMSVLGRIALCYLGASLVIFFAGPAGSLRVSILLLLAYWALCAWLGARGADPYSLEGYAGTALDKYILGEPHLYQGEGRAFDPEGILSTLPAITSVIAGYLAGKFIREKGKKYDMLSGLLLAGMLLLFVAYWWNMLFPVNKKIWTSSYAVAAAGFAAVFLAFFISLLEFKEYDGPWSRFFSVFGKNPLFIFVVSGVVPRLTGLIRIPVAYGAGTQAYSTPLNWFYTHICLPLTGGTEKNASLLFALILVTFYWLIGYWLDRKKIYIKV